MDKVVGARINREIFNKMKEDGRSNTIIIREALIQYYIIVERKTDVNKPLITVNNKKNEDRYKMIIKEIDDL